MKIFLSFSLLPLALFWFLRIDGNPRVKTVPTSEKLNGTWKVDSLFNEAKWHRNMEKGISHDWFEILTLKKDSFFLESHEWMPPHTDPNGKEYFAANFTNYIIGTFRTFRDTLLLDGYYTDYLYSSKVDKMYKYNPVLRFTLKIDTLELSEYSFLKQRMIKQK